MFYGFITCVTQSNASHASSIHQRSPPASLAAVHANTSRLLGVNTTGNGQSSSSAASVSAGSLTAMSHAELEGMVLLLRDQLQNIQKDLKEKNAELLQAKGLVAGGKACASEQQLLLLSAASNGSSSCGVESNGNILMRSSAGSCRRRLDFAFSPIWSF